MVKTIERAIQGHKPEQPVAHASGDPKTDSLARFYQMKLMEAAARASDVGSNPSLSPRLQQAEVASLTEQAAKYEALLSQYKDGTPFQSQYNTAHSAVPRSTGPRIS